MPPMCTKGTHMSDTDGTVSTAGAKAATFGPNSPWVRATALGVPVVPLVNSTTASSLGAGTRVGSPWAPPLPSSSSAPRTDTPSTRRSASAERDPATPIGAVSAAAMSTPNSPLVRRGFMSAAAAPAWVAPIRTAADSTLGSGALVHCCRQPGIGGDGSVDDQGGAIWIRSDDILEDLSQRPGRRHQRLPARGHGDGHGDLAPPSSTACILLPPTLRSERSTTTGLVPHRHALAR